MLSSLKLSYQFYQISHGAFCRRGIVNLLNGSALLNKMAAMPIYMKKKQKTKKKQKKNKKKKHTYKSSFRTKKAFTLNLGILHSERQAYQVCSNDDPRMIFDSFTARSNVWPSCCGNTGRMLHGSCKYAMALLLR